MVKVRMSYFAGKTSSFIPHGKREIERERERGEREGKKRKYNFDHWSRASLPIGNNGTREKRSEKILRKEKNERKY